MALFLSDDWFDALIAQAKATPPAPGLTITLQQTVDAEMPIVWHTMINDDGVTVARGEAASPDVRLRSDLATAAGIHDGSVSAQRAFLDGTLQIGGDLHALMAARETLAGLSLPVVPEA